MTSKVYGLHSGDGLIWYVGQTSQSLRRRLWEHRSRARAGTASKPKADRIVAAGKSLEIVLLYEGADADCAERAFIADLMPVTNRQSGGRAGYSLDGEVRSAISSKLAGRETGMRGKSRPELSQPGESNAGAKLTQAQVDQIRFDYAMGGVSQSALGAEYGVSQSHISAIIRKKRWSS